MGLDRNSIAPRDCGTALFLSRQWNSNTRPGPRSIESNPGTRHGRSYARARQSRSTRATRGRRRYDRKPSQRVFEQKPPVENRCVKLGDPEKPHAVATAHLICMGGRQNPRRNGVVVMRRNHAKRNRRRDAGTAPCEGDQPADGRRGSGSFLPLIGVASGHRCARGICRAAVTTF